MNLEGGRKKLLCLLLVIRQLICILKKLKSERILSNRLGSAICGEQLTFFGDHDVSID